MTNWVYIKSESQLWTVGFYGPDDEWHTDSDHQDNESAAQRVHYLNGGNVNRYDLEPVQVHKNTDTSVGTIRQHIIDAMDLMTKPPSMNVRDYEDRIDQAKKQLDRNELLNAFNTVHDITLLGRAESRPLTINGRFWYHMAMATRSMIG